MNENCYRCEARLPAGARFCPACGAASDASSERVSEDRLALLLRYLPEALVRNVMAESKAPLGQRAVAAVVFADVSGFTAMSENMDPEDVLKVMNGCFEGLVEAVDRHGGVVDKFIGDCLMAIFGVPAAHGDDAARAVRACREMFDYLDEYNQTLARPLGLSIGINYGPLVAGNLGSHLRMDYTVMGATVNLAQRLEAAATAGQILVSEAVKRAAAAEINFEPQKPIRVKGIKDPVNIFLAKDDRASPTEKVTLPCVGRDKYVEALKAALDHERASFVVVDLFGDEGVGKTRIAEEVAARWAQDGEGARMVYLTRAPGYGKDRSYGSIGAIVEAVCGISVDDSAGQRQTKLARLDELEAAKGWILFLQYAASGSGASMGELDGVGIEGGILGATRALFKSLAENDRLVILDGYERYDEPSLKILGRLWPQGPPRGLKLIATRTRTVSPLFGDATWARKAEAKPMDQAGAMALASMRLSTNKIPRAAESFLFTQSGGNPRYLLELIESLIETGHVYSTPGGYIVRDDLVSAGGALNLVTLVRSRLDRLSAPMKYLLQAGALYGSSFPADVVVEAVDQLKSGRQWLAEMATRGLLARDGTYYAFTHAMVHQLAIDNLLSDQRIELLTRLGKALEANPAGLRSESLPLLARFHAEGKDVDKAVYYLERAAIQLMKNGEYLAAGQTYERLAAKQGKRQGMEDAAARAQMMAARAWELTGQMRFALHWYQEAQRTATSAGSKLRLAQSSRHVARTLRLQGDLAEAGAAIERALTLSREVRDDRSEAWSLLEAAEVDLASRNTQSAYGRLEEAARLGGELSGEDEEGSVRGRSLSRLGRLALTAGSLESALRQLEEAASVCEAAGDARELVRLYGNLGVLCHHHEREGARVYFERAIALARKIGDKLGEAKQLHNLGSYLSGAGERHEALQHLNLSYDLATSLEWSEGVAVNANAIRQLESQA